jgi:hypothetical protein
VDVARGTPKKINAEPPKAINKTHNGPHVLIMELNHWPFGFSYLYMYSVRPTVRCSTDLPAGHCRLGFLPVLYQGPNAESAWEVTSYFTLHY